MQAVADAIAEAQNEMAGFHLTRVTSVIAVGQTIWPVESVYEWLDTGQILARGTVYSYTSRSDTALEGITWTDGDTVYTGAAIQIPEEHLITDVTRLRSGVELLRAAILVDLAEGAHLDAVGRNVGVERLPSIPSDDLFREIVKAVAYNPRGTIYGIELLLDAAVGAGNYEIYEDLIEEPNKIKISLAVSAALASEFIGKAFLTGAEFQDETTSTTFSISDNVIIGGTVHGVRFKDENHESDFRNAKPSVETKVEYIGDTGTQLWFFDGANEATQVTQISGEGVQIDDLSGTDVGRYVHPSRIQPESYASLEIVTYLDSTGTLSSSGAQMNQWEGDIADGAFHLSWGVFEVASDSSQVWLGFHNAGTLIGNPVARLGKDRYYSIEIRKYQQDFVELYVDGSLVASQAYSSFTSATTNTEMSFGANNVGLTPIDKHRVKRARYYARTSTDYWGGRGIAGAVLTANDRDLDVGAGDAIFSGGGVDDDQRKYVYIRGGTTQNAQGGFNNGVFVIETVNSAQNLTLQGVAREGGVVLSATPTRFDAPDRLFQYPDDLGKTLVISGATNPTNNGPYTITQLLDADDGVTDLDSRDTRLPEKTSIAIATSASFVTETGLSWRIDPDFVTESNLEWEVADLGSVSGTTVTLRQALPTLAASAGTITRVLQVAFSEVLSAQILEDLTVRNVLVDAGPPRIYSHYPFYLSDPLGFVKFYLDLITAGGVIPEFVS
jgi:hypothetical protein